MVGEKRGGKKRIKRGKDERDPLLFPVFKLMTDFVKPCGTGFEGGTRLLFPGLSAFSLFQFLSLHLLEPFQYCGEISGKGVEAF